MESIPIIAVFVVLIFVCLVFFVTRRLMRLMVRLALAGVLMLIALMGGLTWWYTKGRNASPTPQKEKPAPTRRANSR